MKARVSTPGAKLPTIGAPIITYRVPLKGSLKGSIRDV